MRLCNRCPFSATYHLDKHPPPYFNAPPMSYEEISPDETSLSETRNIPPPSTGQERAHGDVRAGQAGTRGDLRWPLSSVQSEQPGANLTAQQVQEPRRKRVVERMEAMGVGPAEVSRGAYPTDQKLAKGLATQISNIRGGHLVLSPAVAEKIAGPLEVTKDWLLGDLTNREKRLIDEGRKKPPAAPTPVDPAAEKAFRKDALDRFMTDRSLTARQITSDVEPGEEDRDFSAMRLAEARLGDAMVPLRNCRRIEARYGLKPGTLWSGLTEEELNGLSEAEREELFPTAPEVPKPKPARKKIVTKEKEETAGKATTTRRVPERTAPPAAGDDLTVRLDAGYGVVGRLLALNGGALRIAISCRGPEELAVRFEDVLITKDKAGVLLFG